MSDSTDAAPAVFAAPLRYIHGPGAALAQRRALAGGLAAAHAIHNGLTVLHETYDYWHGEKVAFGVISLLVLEGQPQDLINEVVDLCLRVGLPVTLGDIGVEADAETLAPVAEAACAEGETIHNEPFPVTPDGRCGDARRGCDRRGATGAARAYVRAPRGLRLTSPGRPHTGRLSLAHQVPGGPRGITSLIAVPQPPTRAAPVE